MSDSVSELPRPLSAKYRGDFAYPTVKDRIPVILTKVVDHVCRMKSDPQAQEEYGKCAEDLKQICGALSKLKNEIQTDKPLLPLTDDWPDVADWEKYRAEVQQLEGEEPSWFKSAWLYTECYFYRRVTEAVNLSTNMMKFDPFGEQKRAAFMSSLLAIQSLGEHLHQILQQQKNNTTNGNSLREQFLQFLQVCLWGNKCDLSISAGADNFQTANALSQVETLKPYLLSDQSKAVWEQLQQVKVNSPEPRIDIILDNAGFEVFTDLCFAEFLISSGLAKSVHFHAKCIPWFVSDVTQNDFDWTIKQLQQAESTTLQSLGKIWHDRLQNGSWKFVVHKFWTLPHDFSRMKEIAPELYAELSKSDFLFFKGDLNYRKLTGDLKWDHTFPFSAALRGFLPTSLCTLRTLKCDLVVGLESGVAEATKAKEEKWMISGNWAVIQMCTATR